MNDFPAPHITLRFYEELNDHLPVKHRKIRFSRQLTHPASVKDVIESCGVPHPEVELILVNGESVDFEYPVQPNDDLSVYPVFESMDVSSVVRLPKRPLRNVAFIADVHLGKLTRILRILGFDIHYDPILEDAELAEISGETGKVLLTRDRRLLMRKIIDKGYYVRSPNPYEQTVEILQRFQLKNQVSPFSRCPECNGRINPVQKADVDEVLPPMTRKLYFSFRICENCRKVYWEGAHTKKLNGMINRIMMELENDR